MPLSGIELFDTWFAGTGMFLILDYGMREYVLITSQLKFVLDR